MSSQRIVIIILIAVAVLFALCLGFRSTQDPKDVDLQNNGLVINFKGMLEPPAVSAAEMNCSCLKQNEFVLLPGVEKCDGQIAEIDSYFDSVRVARIRNIEGGPVTLIYTPSGSSDDQPIEMTVDVGEQRSWPVRKGGGTFKIQRKESRSTTVTIKLRL